MENVAPIIRAALRGDQGVEELTNERYQEKLAAYQEEFTVDFQQALASTTERKRREAIANGQPSTIVMDSKVVELEVLKGMEAAILSAGTMICSKNKQSDFKLLFDSLRPLFGIFPKVRMAKITRVLIDMATQMPDSSALQIELCLKCIDWCMEEKRTFLRHRIQTKLASLYQQLGKFHSGLELLNDLLKEVKQLDDKPLLVEVHLVESKLNFSVKHLPKAKAALTAAKTNANAIHCPPLLQADMDLVAGCLHAEEKDFRTAYSYFYEAFEAFHVQNDERTVQSLKYMMLCRIMTNQAENITNIGRGTTGLKYLERSDIRCLIELAEAYSSRSLERFESALHANREHIENDTVLSRHIEQASEQLLEQSIVEMTRPYSQVEISHIARKARLSESRIQSKLSEMILDGAICGTLDQKRGVFVMYDQVPPNKLYQDSAESFKNLKQIVSVLLDKVENVL